MLDEELYRLTVSENFREDLTCVKMYYDVVFLELSIENRKCVDNFVTTSISYHSMYNVQYRGILFI